MPERPKRSGVHGMPEYTAWCNMIARCYNPKSPRYPRYGGRGIQVCDRWRESFSNFLEDVGKKPGPGYQLDRRENDGNYEKENCRWVTGVQNARNKSNNRVIDTPYGVMTAAEVSERYGLNHATVAWRIRQGKSFEDVVCSGVVPRRKSPCCRRGHPFTAANTCVLSNGTRRCRKCHNASVAAYNARRRAGKEAASS